MRIVVGILLIAPACAGSDDAILDRVFDPCAPFSIAIDPGLDADRRAAVDAAVAQWGQVIAVAADTAVAVEPVLQLRFESAAPAFHGAYLDEAAEIVINTDLADAHARAVTIAHELGHAFGLWHVEDRASVMSPGNLEVEPTPDDAAAVASLWPSCQSP